MAAVMSVSVFVLLWMVWLPAGSPFTGTKTTELLLDPGFRGTIRLYAAPDKKGRVKLLRHNVKAEDWIYFVVRASNDSMFQVSAEYSIQGHIADGWIDKNEHIGVYSRVYEDGKSLVLYAAPGEGDVAAKIPHYVRTLIPVTGCEKGWVRVKMTDKGKVFEGWLSPGEQCADAYTTCN